MPDTDDKQTQNEAEDLRKAPDGGGHWELGGERDDTFKPDTVEANRSIEQGNGVGQSEIDLQRDPERGERDQRFGDGAGLGGDVPGRAPGEDA